MRAKLDQFLALVCGKTAGIRLVAAFIAAIAAGPLCMADCPGFISLGEILDYGRYHTAVGIDVDGDGRKEIFAGRGSEDEPSLPGDQLWGSDESGEFVLRQEFDVKSSYSAAGDIDSDGDEDVVVYVRDSEPGGIWVYRNIDGLLVPEHAFSVNTFDFDSFGVILRDIDGEGSLDVIYAPILVSGFPRYLLNDGVGGFPGPSLSFDSGDGGANRTLLGAGDIDGDGDVDFIFGASDFFLGAQPSNVLLNDGSGTLTFAYTLDFYQPSVPGALADLDGDGDLDLFCVGAVQTPPTSPAHTIWQNDGRGGFTLAWSSPNAPISRIPQVANLNRDGLPDVYIAVGPAGTQHESYVSLGACEVAPIFTLPPITLSMEHFAPIDLDGDGDDDFVFPVRGSAGFLQIAWNGERCVGDLNFDGVVNGADLAGVIALWGETGGYLIPDCDLSGMVDGEDLATLLANWGACRE